MKPTAKLMAVFAIAGALAFAALAGCGSGSSNGSTDGTGKTISTDATANKALLTTFTGPNSVTIAGTWTNTYFSSQGQVTINVVFDSATNVATINFVNVGNVFGNPNPPAETYTVNMSDFITNGTAVLTASSAIYGDIAATLTYYTDSTGTFAGTATNVPGGLVTNVVFSGTFALSGSAVTFTIDRSSFDYEGTSITCTQSLTTTIN